MNAGPGLPAKKSLGQHFLVNQGVIQRIVAEVPREPRQLIEIGPGEGALLMPLLETGRPVTVLEKDCRLAEQWRDAGLANLAVIECDAAEDDWISGLDQPTGVVGNLPYNVATAILRRMVFAHGTFPWMILMFQKEVAERIETAGSRQGGAMGMLVQLAYAVRTVIDAGPGSFRPPPRVDSRVIRLDRLADPLPETQLPQAWSLIKSMYHRRRARVDKAIARHTNQTVQTVQAWFEQAGIRQDARADHIQPGELRQLIGAWLA